MGSKVFSLLAIVLASAAFVLPSGAKPKGALDRGNAAEAPIDFTRDIRPILSEKCVICHGPDEADREADLRFDQRETVFEDRGGYFVVVPGKSEESELFLRVADPDDPMPPASAGLDLTPEEIELLRRWIDEGAEWEEHWAYVPPRVPETPRTGNAGWIRDPIDAFTLARMEEEGLTPEPEATREELIRRVTFDLTGLPPTLEEVDAYLADDGPDAYGKVVDKLLATPQYAESMARDWLDAARYGDTHGYHLDNERALWRWRDWVIDAFDANKPFDEFTVEQLAGDLLPDPTVDQLIATGFNRCNPTTGEGGLIADEYLVKYAVDRVETTATVFLGTTLGCAQCHEHKYDPFSQKEFYEFFAYFHSFAEDASDRNALTPPPSIAAPTLQQRSMLEALGLEVDAVRARLDAPMPAVDAAQVDWEREWAAELSARWHVLEPLSAHSSGGATTEILPDASVLVAGENPAKAVHEVVAQTDATGITALHLEALTHASFVNGGVGRATNANVVLSELELEMVPAGRSGSFVRVPLKAAYADYSQPNYNVAGAIDDDPNTGWGVNFGQTVDRSAVFLFEEPIGFAEGTVLRVRLRHESVHQQHAIGRFRLSVTAGEELRPSVLYPWYVAGPFAADDARTAFDTDYGAETEIDLAGELGWEPRPDFADGAVHQLEGGIAATYLCRTIHSPTARRMTLSLGSDDGIKVWLNGELVLDRDVARAVAPDQERITIDLAAGDNRLLLKIVNYGGQFGFFFRAEGEELTDLPIQLARAVTTPAERRSEEEAQLLRQHYRAKASPEWAAIRDELADAETRVAALEAEIPRTMITRDLETPRPTNVLIRGRYDQPGEEVSPGVPAALGPLPEDAPANRLGLARWLVDPEHPLTARVTVNRFWQRYFGRGLVETPEDFGTRGSVPSHPELLDLLARDFVASGWNVKAMQRRIVTSATYRQSARAGAAKRARDPDNALYARGPRFRLDAEAVRDSALAISGLLVQTIGGPSVKPYQPKGLWKAVGYTSSNTANFTQDTGDALYRRSMYTFWKRTSPPPTMALFDAPTREACTVDRARTNTPLQALALMNDVQFVEAARAFGERILREGGASVDERLTFAFRLATARVPDAGELAVLRGVLDAQAADFRADAAGAAELLEVGDSEPDASLDPVELAAWTMAASLILNLDETMTRG